MCEEAARLLGLYTSALKGFHRAQGRVVDGKLKPSDGQFAQAIVDKKAAYRTLLGARRCYWDHVREHGCRETKARPAVTPPAPRSQVGILCDRLREAKKQMDLAHDGLNDAREVQTTGLSAPADGQYLYRRALEIQEFAASEYLRILADLKAAVPPAQNFDHHGNDGPTGEGDQARSGVGLLTQREIQVLKLIASGQSGREIGEVLGIAPKTVTVHRQNIYSKLQVHKTADLVRIALRMGLIEQ